MGSYLTKLNVCQTVPISTTSVTHFKSERPAIKLLLLGLDNAGKTTTALHLIGDPLEDIIPTIGFSNLELRRYGKYRVVVYDLGGGVRIRGIWKNYFALVHGIIFVIDSSDISRIYEVKDVIEEVVSNDKISGKPILVLINKQDLEGALEELDICQYLKLESLINKFKCPTKVETCSANSRPENGPKTDPSIDSGYKWLLSFVAKNWDQLNQRVENDSNEQYNQEKKSLEDRVNRLRIKKFEANEDNDDELYESSDNERQFFANGNPFKAIKDVVKDVDKQNKPDLSDDNRNRLLMNTNPLNINLNHNKTNSDIKVLNGDKDNLPKYGSSPSDESTSTGGYTSNDATTDSNDILTNSRLSGDKAHHRHNASGDGSHQQKSYHIDSSSPDAMTLDRDMNQLVNEIVINSHNSHTKDLLESGKKAMSPENNENFMTSDNNDININNYFYNNNNNSHQQYSNSHKKVKRKTKAMRSSKVSPDLTKNS